MQEKEYKKLLDHIMKELITKGIKATTMDSLALSLQMSKRTLYEIFANKNEMVAETLKEFHKKMEQSYKSIFNSSSNVMESLLKWTLINRDFMSSVNVAFFKDLEGYIGQIIENKGVDNHYDEILNLMQQGVTEGYFRNDINFIIQIRMMSIQMEALKRTEELFPPDITLLDVYDSISIGFLRSICSEKGLKLLDEMLARHNDFSSEKKKCLTFNF